MEHKLPSIQDGATGKDWQLDLLINAVLSGQYTGGEPYSETLETRLEWAKRLNELTQDWIEGISDDIATEDEAGRLEHAADLRDYRESR